MGADPIAQFYKHDKELDVVKIAQALIQINSENGIHPEDSVRKFVESLLSPWQFEIYLDSFTPERINLLAVKRPNLDASLILFSGHMDTVVGYDSNHSDIAEIKEGNLFGRGACDMKGPIASFLASVLNWLNSHKDSLSDGSKGVALLFTVDEETGCKGIMNISSPNFFQVFQHCEYCILGEPTNLSPVIGHKGINWYNITFHGKAVHASVPETGDNAILKAMAFIAQVQDHYNELQSRTSLLGSPKLNIGTIQGGQATNIVPNKCVVSVDRRFIPGENPKDELEFLTRIARKIDSTAEIEELSPGWAYLLPDGDKNPLYLHLVELLGKGKYLTLPAYTEADAIFRLYQVPTIIYGPGSIDQAHQTPEYISIDDLTKGEENYTLILKDFFS